MARFLWDDSYNFMIHWTTEYPVVPKWVIMQVGVAFVAGKWQTSFVAIQSNSNSVTSIHCWPALTHIWCKTYGKNSSYWHWFWYNAEQVLKEVWFFKQQISDYSGAIGFTTVWNPTKHQTCCNLCVIIVEPCFFSLSYNIELMLLWPCQHQRPWFGFSKNRFSHPCTNVHL